MTVVKEFENQVFKKENWGGLELKHRVYTRCRFEGCDFTQTDFTGSRFLECSMKGCNLSLTKFDGARLQDLKMEDCKLVGVNFCKCDPLFLSLGFKTCVLDTVNFSDLELKGTVFIECIIRETYFTNCKLAGANFARCDLKGSTFHNADLKGADFRGAINYAINPLTNQLKNARFSQPEAFALLHHLGIILDS